MYIPPYVYPHKAVTIIPQRKIHSNLINRKSKTAKVYTSICYVV